MKFKKIKVESSDLYYDLFDGGYIKPSKMLENPEDVATVEKAIETIRKFLDEAQRVRVLEVY